MHKKKVLVTIIALFSLLFLGAGVYLLWRVNQEDKTVAPTGSSATGNVCDGVGARWLTEVNGKTYTYGVNGAKLQFYYLTGDTDGVDASSITVDIDGKPVKFTTEDFNGKKNIKIIGDLQKYPDGTYIKPGRKVLTIKWKDVKGAGFVAPCVAVANFNITNTCDAYIDPSWNTDGGWKIRPEGKIFDHCATSIPFAFVVSDSDGVKKDSIKVTIDKNPFTKLQITPQGTKGFLVSGDLGKGTGSDCLNTGIHTLRIKWTDIEDAGNECPCEVTATFNIGAKNNVCDENKTSKWEAKPSGEYKYCQDISYTALLQDSDGIGNITVTLNGQTRNSFRFDAQTSKVTETLSSKQNCLTPGNYALKIQWTDKLGVGEGCELNTSFKVSPELQPDMTITKTPTENCVDNNTEDVKSELSYIIKIKNNGKGEGKITNITDTLDPKVNTSSITDISGGGKVVGQSIVWNLEGANQVFASGQEKQYTYKYTVQKDAFGQYDNKVIATVGSTDTQPSSKIEAHAQIPTTCQIPGTPPPPPATPQQPTVPATGIFDNSLVVVAIGAIIMIMGLGWNWLSPTSGIFVTQYKENKRRNFEKKVTKDI